MSNLVQHWYEALGFSTPGTEYDPATGTYQLDLPLATDVLAHGCGADPQDCERWLSELDGADLDWEAS